MRACPTSYKRAMDGEMRWGLIVSAAALLVAGGAAPARQAVPAVMEAPLGWADMPLHDPWIVADRASGSYWLFTSNVAGVSGVGGVGVMAYRSRDLLHWTRPVVVFRLAEGRWAKAGGWAPEVHRWRGRWYLFTTVHDEAAALTPVDGRHTYRRGTMLAVADRLSGPFVAVRGGEPVAPPSLMTLDGTLFRDGGGRPWMVYAHEWIQTGDGTIEAVPLDASLKRAGNPRVLFRASEASWVHAQAQPAGPPVRVTDGPELFRTRSRALMMLWSSYGADGYTQGLARSRTGTLAGPWEQLPPLVTDDAGHGMIFYRFDRQPMLVMHHPFKNARGRLYEVRDTGRSIALGPLVGGS